MQWINGPRSVSLPVSRRWSPSLGQGGEPHPVAHPWARQPQPPHTHLERGTLHIDGRNLSGPPPDPQSAPMIGPMFSACV